MTKIIDSDNKDIINTYIGLKNNNLNTDLYLKVVNDIKITKVDDLGKILGFFNPYTKELKTVQSEYSKVISHELMHAATTNINIKKVLSISTFLYFHTSSSRFFIILNSIGEGIDEGIVEFLQMIIKMDLFSENEISADYVPLNFVGMELYNLFNIEEFNKLIFDATPTIFYSMLAKKIGILNTLKLLMFTDKYKKVISSDNEILKDKYFSLIIELLQNINKKQNIKLFETKEFDEIMKILEEKIKQEKENEKKLKLQKK